MKYCVFIFSLFIYDLIPYQVYAQPGSLILSGGKIWGDIENAVAMPKGGGAVLTGEVVPKKGKLVHDFSLGFTSTNFDIIDPIYGYPNEQHLVNNTILFYYAPKYLIGNGSFKGFVRGGAGMHCSKLFEPSLSGKSNEENKYGFYYSLGAGIMQMISGKVFVNLGYDFSYSPDSFYENGTVGALMLGLGIGFD